MKKELQEHEEGCEADIHLELLRATHISTELENFMTLKMDSGYYISRPSMTDRLYNCVKAYKKQVYLNGWQKAKQPCSRKTPQKSHLQQLYTNNCLAMMWKILIAQIWEKSVTHLYATDCFHKNRKEATGEQEEEAIFWTLTRKSSMRAKRRGWKM